MKIWVDADACPNVIKEILFRAANREKVKITLVANQYINIPKSPFIDFTKVSSGFDIADAHIVQQLEKDDLVITADIPLASEVIKKDGFAINPRGTFYSKENIGERLSMRNLMDELRSTGQISGGPAVLGKKERQAFANALDSFITKHKNK